MAFIDLRSDTVTRPTDAMRAAIANAAGVPVRVGDWQQANSSFFTAIQVERNVMFLILTLIVLVAALNIVSGLIMLVKDKSADIAILRTMGATRSSILRVFLITGASIGIYQYGTDGTNTLLEVVAATTPQFREKLCDPDQRAGAPGGPFDAQRRLPPEVERNVKAAYNLDKPLSQQYLIYLGKLAHGDLGPSYKNKDFTCARVLCCHGPHIGGSAACRIDSPGYSRCFVKKTVDLSR